MFLTSRSNDSVFELPGEVVDAIGVDVPDVEAVSFKAGKAISFD